MKDASHKQPLIFVVDDDEDDLYFIKSALESNIPECTVRCFIHGKQFIDELAVTKSLPAFVLLDLNMPIMNGKEALKQVRMHPVAGCVPVIIFSTSNNPNEKELCFKYGANEYFCKPSSLSVYDELVQKLKGEYIDGVAAAN